MVTEKVNKPLVESKPFFVRKLTKAGGSKYLSIGSILPTDWEACKVIVERLDGGVYILRLEQIK